MTDGTNLMDTPDYDASIFDEPVSEEMGDSEEEVYEETEDPGNEEESGNEDGSEEEEQQQDDGEEEEAESEAPRKFANKYNTEDDLIKGYTNLVNVYRDRVEQLAEVTGDDSYLSLLDNVQKEFDTVEELEDSYKQLNNDYQRQARTLNVLKGKKKEQVPAQQPVNQYNIPQQQGQVIPPELAANPNFMNLMQTNPLQAVEHIVQHRVQEAIKKQEQTFQEQMMQRERQNLLMMQVGEIKQKPDFEDLRDDIIETLEELPSLAQQPNGIAQAYEYAKLKQMRRELSENSITAQQIKINNQLLKKKASAPVSGSSKTTKAVSPEEQIVSEMFGQDTKLYDFLR